jgi:hypothetical protein
MHVLVTGWFSFEQMGNTAGDMIACDIVCSWLKDAAINYEVAVASPFSYSGKIKLEDVQAETVTDIIFVCGPFGNGWPITDLLKRFSHCRLTGINLSLLEPLDTWNPFHLLHERDSSRATHPDITFIAPPPVIPVVGIILAHKQKEYGVRSLHEKANAVIEDFISQRELSVVRIDTALEKNQGGLRTPGEVESLIAKMDVVITTRLHGTVLSLKNRVPAIAIDPIADGAKITKQVETFGWPVLFNAGNVHVQDLSRAFDYCLTNEGRLKASECVSKAVKIIADTRQKFMEEFSIISTSVASYG